jgi:hypothetical protein
MAFAVVYDTCALYPNTQRNLLIRVARAGLVRARGDFPADLLGVWGVEGKSPDDFVLDLLGINGRVVHACVQQIVDERRNPPETFEDVLGQLERSGLIESVAELRSGLFQY